MPLLAKAARKRRSITYWVYMLQCADDSLYTGITTDIERRFAEHKAGKGGAYTRSHGTKKIVYKEKKKDRSAASRREAEIKHWSREQKLAYVRQAFKKP